MKNRIFIVFCSLFLAALSAFFILLIVLLVNTFTGTSSIRTVSHSELFFAIKLTLFSATISSVLAIMISLPVSYILARKSFPFRSTIEALLCLPIVVSPVSLGAMLLLFFNTPAGRFVEEHIGKVVFEVPGVILAQFVVIIGLSISLIKSVFSHINPAYEQIARTLGATEAQAFRLVLLPLSSKGILTAFLLTWARAVSEFGATVMLAGATAMKTETLPVAIYLSFSSADIHGASLFIVTSLFISLFILFAMRKLYD